MLHLISGVGSLTGQSKDLLSPYFNRVLETNAALGTNLPLSTELFDILLREKRSDHCQLIDTLASLVGILVNHLDRLMMPFYIAQDGNPNEVN